jgi:predicted GIY-YIG superfamily endonuclease
MRWTNPIELKKYKLALRGPGLYMVGKPRVTGTSLRGNGQSDPYLLENWPDGMLPLYVGISLSYGSGMRGRLSAHARGKGSKFLKKELAKKERLYFIQIIGENAAEYEALFIQLQNNFQFAGNIRNEIDRAAKRRYEQRRAKISQFERDYYDNLDPRDV